jgi:hypothetical protein
VHSSIEGHWMLHRKFAETQPIDGSFKSYTTKPEDKNSFKFINKAMIKALCVVHEDLLKPITGCFVQQVA